MPFKGLRDSGDASPSKRLRKYDQAEMGPGPPIQSDRDDQVAQTLERASWITAIHKPPCPPIRPREEYLALDRRWRHDFCMRYFGRKCMLLSCFLPGLV